VRAHHGWARDPPALPLAHLESSNQKGLTNVSEKKPIKSNISEISERKRLLIKDLESRRLRGARGGNGGDGGGRRPAGRGRGVRGGGGAGGWGWTGGCARGGRKGGSRVLMSAWRRGRGAAAAAAAGARGGSPSFLASVRSLQATEARNGENYEFSEKGNESIQ